jgi:hypothetical protein
VSCYRAPGSVRTPSSQATSEFAHPTGSVALGHALGSTGARMIVTLVHEMRRRQVEHGAATLCGGGGQGDALLVRLPTR